MWETGFLFAFSHLRAKKPGGDNRRRTKTWKQKYFRNSRFRCGHPLSGNGGEGALQFWKTRVRIALPTTTVLYVPMERKKRKGKKTCPFFFFFFSRLTLKTVKQYQASGDTGFDVRCEVWDWKTYHYTSSVFHVHLSCNFTFCTYHNNSYMFAKCPSNGS